jgi:hypothetical protein
MRETARERLATLLADTCDQLVYRQADAILKALHLTDAAALALMEGEAVVTPKWLTLEQHAAAQHETDRVKFYHAALRASPYKDNSNAE